jgi:L,D-peptidoglycan transpeptidase YkuD (ErfK/YbiS/YcfS/YnhG family)
MKNKLLFLGFTTALCLIASAEINPVDVNLLHPCSNLDQDQSIPADTSQVILVSTECSHDVQADLNLCEKKNNTWISIKQFPAVVGKNGIAAKDVKIEGDMMTPSGVYPIGTAFGYHPLAKSQIPGLKMDYRYISPTKDINHKSIDKFVDDVASFEYNSWVVGSTTANSFEEMRRQDDLYEYGLVLNYNMPATPGKGSSIFMHIWRSAEKGTAGCVALAKPNLIQIMRWLDKDKKPMIKVIAPQK